MEGQPDLLAWTRANYPKDPSRLDWFKERICFIYDEIPHLLAKDTDQADEIRKDICVIFEYLSDTENVPEVLIKHPNGLEIVLFWTVVKDVWKSEWYVSVKSPKKITAKFDYSLFPTTSSLYIQTFKGLPSSWMRVPAYGTGSDHFEFSCRNTYRLHTILWLIGQNLGLRNK